MRTGWMWRMVPAVFLLLSGCYGAKLIRQPIAVDNTEQRVESLAERQAMLDAASKRMEEASARQEEMIRSLRADTQTRLQELSEAIQALQSQVSDQSDRPRSYMRVPDWQPPPSAGPVPADSASSSPAMAPAQLKQIYDNAYLDLNRGNYSLALLGFRDYLTRSPDSDLADNAQYWIGECHYAQRDFRKAIEEFAKVEQSYPKGDKIPASKLKIAYSHLQLEDRTAARSQLRDLVQRYPNSEEAAQARSKLSSLE